MPEVDVVVLTRDRQPLREEVLQAIQTQADVEVRLHRVIGTPRESDAGRWQTIARARNVGRTLGGSPWLMFVDDDVVLGEHTITQLLSELQSQTLFAARAADYLGERESEGATHVAMGATLFRRDALAQTEFRWEDSKCECLCMTEDLRRQRLGIDYSPTATAIHLEHKGDGERSHTTCSASGVTAPSGSPEDSPDSPTSYPVSAVATSDSSGEESEIPHRDGEILAAFNRAHVRLFLDQFVARLRHTGNENQIHALTYGLRGKHVRQLQQVSRVSVYENPHTVELVFLKRMLGFQSILRDMCPHTPVAYWDAGDVLFQKSLESLWELVRAQPRKLHVVEEPLPFKNGHTPHARWANRISDSESRHYTNELLHDKPVINGGFIASSAGRLLEYFEMAHALSVGKLLGAGGGDQVILNYCRYKHPEEFVVVDETWNYCLFGREHCRIKDGRYFDTTSGELVSVVHGNARTLVL